MELAPFEFYLTGSRLFGQEHMGSDWDFFVEFHPRLEAWLRSWGFREESNPSYSFRGLAAIWKHECESVHVQVVDDARLKLAVQTALLSSGYVQWMYSISNEDRVRVWDLAIHLYQCGMMAGQTAP